MISRDFFFYMAIFTPAMVLAMALLLPAMESPEDGVEPLDLTYLYWILVADVGVSIGVIYWRWHLYSSILTSGVETPGAVTSVTKSGESMSIEFTYRWQAETVKSTKMVQGYLLKRRLNYRAGMNVTLLVDANKPQRFLVLDTLR